MKVLRFSSLVLSVAALTAASTATAQSVKTGDRVMVPTLQSSDKELGVAAAEAIRNQLQKSTNVKELVVVPKADINNSLASSGYSTTEALAPGDAKALATLVRAAQYVDGSVTKTPTGFEINSRLVISRDQTRGQVLPVARAGKLDDAANQVAKAIKDARRQVGGEEACHNAQAQGKYDEAIKAARGTLASYPTANIVAVCLAEAYSGKKMDDSVVAVSERIVASDPRNIMALRYLADIYGTRKDPRATDILFKLVAADPTNLKIQQAVINDLAASGKSAQAIPLVRDLLQNNPGDPQLLSLAWLVYLNAKDYEGAVNIGAEMVRVDTAAASADYYRRLAAAYASMNQPQKAAEAAARGAAKFPNDPTLGLIGAQTLMRSGNLQAALDAAKRAIAADPKNSNAYLLLATIQGQMMEAAPLASREASSTELMNTIQSARTNGVDPAALSQVALQQGSNAYKAGQASKDIADFQRAIRFLQLSDQLQTSADAKFLLGASAFSVGQTATINANERKSCDLARTARDAFTLAQANLPAGGQKYPNEAAQLLTAIPQFTPAVDNEVKRFCK
ncbi:MAG TPA: tetratricopeptide repeat protein [Gemmatimonadaceae bacterium]|nr:tetratricopeptide repeat protein [Gemmatimonadaceae bacterium]